ncbi:hypothetical protein [Anatilimnocola floriformis]|uniref:hypothetical protein n=1 Tax=Anatilimnocola floriformis TaxID=2948575 RepID=UPI0020C5278A|nr:hypothetical protein [Anatilimnocola floriformis]
MIVVTVIEHQEPPDTVAVLNFGWEFPLARYQQAENSAAARAGVIHGWIRDAVIFLAKARGWDWESLLSAAQHVEQSGFIYQAALPKKAWSADRKFGVTAGVWMSPDCLKLRAFLYRRGNPDPIAVRDFAELPPCHDSLQSFIGGVRYVRNARWQVGMPSWSFARKRWDVNFADEVAALSDKKK